MVDNYTLGIAMHDGQVALIKKKRPTWQAGRFNFIGGKIEDGEDPRTCMSREFREETGVDIPAESWQPLGSIVRKDDFYCHVFYFNGPEVQQVKTMTDEVVMLVDDDAMSIESDYLFVSNLRTLYEFAWSFDFRSQNAQITLTYP